MLAKCAIGWKGKASHLTSSRIFCFASTFSIITPYWQKAQFIHWKRKTSSLTFPHIFYLSSTFSLSLICWEEAQQAEKERPLTLTFLSDNSFPQGLLKYLFYKHLFFYWASYSRLLATSIDLPLSLFINSISKHFLLIHKATIGNSEKSFNKVVSPCLIDLSL